MKKRTSNAEGYALAVGISALFILIAGLFLFM